MIDITGVNLRQFVQEVYALSRPQGLGFIPARPGGLSDEDADAIIAREGDDPARRIVASMDYVHGRACKMTVFKSGDKLTIGDSWFDHSPAQLDELLRRCGVARLTAAPSADTNTEEHRT